MNVRLRDVAAGVTDRYSTPNLTTVRPDKTVIARTALDMLDQRILHGHAAKASDIQVGFELVVRESTAGRATHPRQPSPDQTTEEE